MITPHFFHILSQLKQRFVSIVVTHKKLIVVSTITTVLLIGFGTFAMRLRNRLISQMTATQNKSSFDVYYATKSGNTTASLQIATASSDILGTSSVSDVPIDTQDPLMDFPTLAPFPTPIPNPTPYPTFTPIAASTPQNCAGTATSNNSQVYVSPTTTPVGTSATISVELRDCNNSLASNDSLRIALQNTDATAKINGQSPSVTIQAQNGKASFTVSSQTVGTDTLVITDTNQNFTVTEPYYHNPSITFGNNSAGNAHCTTVGGEPNPWYSDVYPASPVSAAAGSTVTFAVIIRDCNQNPVSSDSVSVSVSSGGSGAQINGGPNHTTFLVQNGQGNFTVTSAVAGTVGLTVTDITHSFPVTDTNTNNPSVIFSGSSAPAPTPAPQNSPTPTPGTATPTPYPAPTSTPGPTSTVTPTPTPN